MGDQLLGHATDHLNNWRMLNDTDKSSIYVGHFYDLWFCRSPILMSDNILLRISNTLAERINQVVRLPRFIIVIIDDEDLALTKTAPRLLCIG